MSRHLDFGARGESIAVQYLVDRNWEILEKNYESPLGELDIVGLNRQDSKEPILAFVEVKTRQQKSGIPPERSVTRGKRERIGRIGKYFVSTHELPEFVIRFDVIAVSLDGDEPEITHYPSAFDHRGRLSV